MSINKTEETLKLFKEIMLEYRSKIKHDFDHEKLEPYLVFFDDIPTKCQPRS